MKTIIVDPFPRKMELIFKSSKLKLLKKKFNIINAPKENIDQIRRLQLRELIKLK